MIQEKVRRWFLAATPLIAVIFLMVFYTSFLFVFLKCNWGTVGCNALVIEGLLPETIVLSPTPSASPPPAATSPSVTTNLPTGTNNLLENTSANRTLQVLGYSGRITWGFLMMTYMLLSLVAVIVASVLTYNIFSDWRKRPSIWVLITLAISAGFGFLIYKSPETMYLLKPLLEKTVQNDIREIVPLTSLVNSIGFAASFALVLASCAILLPQFKDSSPDGLRDLSQRMNYLRIVLYVGTLLLVVGILLMRSLFHWSLAFIRAGDGVDKIMEGFISSVISAEAGFYTLVLAGVYLPAAFILQWRARSLKGLPPETSKKNEILAGYGLTFSFKESLPRLIAILGPLLVGPLGDLIKYLPKE